MRTLITAVTIICLAGCGGGGGGASSAGTPTTPPVVITPTEFDNIGLDGYYTATVVTQDGVQFRNRVIPPTEAWIGENHQMQVRLNIQFTATEMFGPYTPVVRQGTASDWRGTTSWDGRIWTIAFFVPVPGELRMMVVNGSDQIVYRLDAPSANG